MANLPLLVQDLQAAIHLQGFVVSYFHASWSNPSEKQPSCYRFPFRKQNTPPSIKPCKILRAPPRSGGVRLFPKGCSVWQLWICWMFRSLHLLRKKRCSLSFWELTCQAKTDTLGKSAEGSKIQSESKAATTRGGSKFERMEPSYRLDTRWISGSMLLNLPPINTWHLAIPFLFDTNPLCLGTPSSASLTFTPAGPCRHNIPHGSKWTG